MSYLAERFEAAIGALVADGPIKERLTAAYTEHLDDLDVSEFPPALRPAFSELHATLHRVRPTGREACVKATIRKMSSVEARAHAATILALFAELMAQGRRAEPLKVVTPEKRRPPSFLTSGA